MHNGNEYSRNNLTLLDKDKMFIRQFVLLTLEANGEQVLYSYLYLNSVNLIRCVNLSFISKFQNNFDILKKLFRIH